MTYFPYEKLIDVVPPTESFHTKMGYISPQWHLKWVCFYKSSNMASAWTKLLTSLKHTLISLSPERQTPHTAVRSPASVPIRHDYSNGSPARPLHPIPANKRSHLTAALAILLLNLPSVSQEMARMPNAPVMKFWEVWARFKVKASRPSMLSPNLPWGKKYAVKPASPIYPALIANSSRPASEIDIRISSLHLNHESFFLFLGKERWEVW